MKRFRGRLVSKAHRLLYHLTLGSRVIKKKKKIGRDVPRRLLSGLAIRPSKALFAVRPRKALFGACLRVYNSGVRTKASRDSLPLFSDKMYALISFRKSTPPQNRQLVRPSKALFGACLRVYNSEVRTKALGDDPPL